MPAAGAARSQARAGPRSQGPSARAPAVARTRRERDAKRHAPAPTPVHKGQAAAPEGSSGSRAHRRPTAPEPGRRDASCRQAATPTTTRRPRNPDARTPHATRPPHPPPPDAPGARTQGRLTPPGHRATAPTTTQRPRSPDARTRGRLTPPGRHTHHHPTPRAGAPGAGLRVPPGGRSRQRGASARRRGQSLPSRTTSSVGPAGAGIVAAAVPSSSVLMRSMTASRSGVSSGRM